MDENYGERREKSEKLAKRATKVLPGGDTRSVTFYTPYPDFVVRASGARFETADGDLLIDYLNNYTQSVLGHAPEPVVDVMCERLRQGNDVAAPNEDIIRLAERIVERTPSVESVRFGNSGTEATMNAIRAALAWTDRERVLKIDGGYHGTHDTVEVAVGDEGVAAGIPTDVVDRVDAVPFNDIEALKSTFARYGEEYGCFILEPIMGVGGMIPATQAYLEAARDLTADSGVVLIFDEVMSYRLGTGGAQLRYGVQPDLTAFGKLIGGGLPIGAFGGRDDLMKQFHPETGVLNHSGTFNGNPATMAGGVATLDLLDEEAISEINTKGDALRATLQDIGDSSEVPVQITGAGSLFQIHFTEEPVSDLKTSTAGDAITDRLFREMQSRGVFIAPRGMGNLSTAIGDEELKSFSDAFTSSLSAISAADDLLN